MKDALQAIKTLGGKPSHVMNEVTVACLPKDLPLFIEVDMMDVEKGQIVHMSDLKLPEGTLACQLALAKITTRHCRDSLNTRVLI